MEKENSILPAIKEHYGLKKLSANIALGNKLLSEIVDKIPKEYFEKGESYFDKNEFTEAVKCYTKAIEHKSDFAFAFCKRGHAYLNLDEYYNAIIDFDKAIQLKPDYNDAYFGRGITKGAPLKDFEGSIADLSKAIELEPKDAWAYFFRGRAHDHTGNLKGAMEDFLKAGQNGLKEGAQEVKKALTKMNEENYEAYGTIERLSNKIILDRDDAELYYKRGFIKRELKDYLNSIVDFSKSISINDEQASCFFFRAMSRHDLGDIHGALIDYTKAIELEYDYSAAYNNRARIKSELKDFEGAIGDYKKRIEYGKIDKTIYYNVGWSYANLANNQYNSNNRENAANNYDESITYFSKAIEIDETYAVAYGSRGISKRMLAFLRHGIATGNQNEKDGACADLKKAYDLGDERASAILKDYCK